jgi:hypothetical protein
MITIRRTFMSVATLVLAGGLFAVLAAQQQQPGQQQPGQQQPPGQTQQESIARGELLSVNVDAKTLSVRTAEKTEMQFTYDDRTQVTGAKEGAAGLASMKGSQVTVHFTRSGQSNLASKIEVTRKSE